MNFYWPRRCSGPDVADRTKLGRSPVVVLAALFAAGILLAGCQSSRSAGSSQGAEDRVETAAIAPGPATDTTSVPASATISPETLGIEPQVLAEPTFEQQLAAITPLEHRVALLLPLSGPAEAVGKALLNAAQLALFEFADSGFELVVHDTEGTPDGAARAGRQAVLDGSSMIIGPLRNTSVEQVAPAARAAGINMVAFSNDRFVAGDGVFIMGFLPGTQVDRVVTYATSRGIRRIAVLAPDEPYGLEVVNRLRRAVSNSGGELTQIEFYDPLAEDVSAPVRRIASFESRQQQLAAQRRSLAAQGGEVARRALARLDGLQTAGALPYDALMIADGGKRLQAVAALLPYYDIDPATVQILGTGQWDEPTVGAEPALVGSWFAAPPPEARAGFEQRYQEAYGETPIRLSTLAYDATALAAVLARTPGGPDFSFHALTNPRGFSGRDGIFRFHTDGMIERGLAVIQVEPRGSRVIDPAPEAFAAP